MIGTNSNRALHAETDYNRPNSARHTTQDTTPTLLPPMTRVVIAMGEESALVETGRTRSRPPSCSDGE
ncbi:hypothetical protein GCM10017752_00500 [Streptomyces roseoviridis]